MNEKEATSTIWQQVLEQLRLQMTKGTFDTLLRGSQMLSHDGDNDGDIWVIGVVNAYALDWLNQRLMPIIQRTARRLAGRPVQIRFVVPDLAPPSESEPNAPDTHDPDTYLLEAVQEERVTLYADGSTLVWSDFYIKLKVAFRKRALRLLRGAKLSVFLCLALHIDRYGVSSPGIERIMEETGYNSRSTVCSALEDLVRLRLVERLSPNRWGNDRYRLLGYAWFGQHPAPALFEEEG